MPKPCTHSSADGYSLVELLVAVAVGAAVMVAALTLALTSRRLYEHEQARTSLNQTLRVSKELISVDIRQAGERLGENFPAIEIIRGEDLPGGSAGDPDELVLRRNLLDTVLLVCEDVDPVEDDVRIALKVTVIPGCSPLPTEPGDTFPVNLQAWSDERVADGGQRNAYIYNPVTHDGEFFVYDSELEDADGFYVRKPVGSSDWLFAYPAADQCRVYLLEERRYRLVGDLLELVIDEQTSVSLVNLVDDFQLLAHPAPTSAVPNPPPIESFDGIDWPDLANVEVFVDGSVENRGRVVNGAWSARIAPRNAL